MPQNVGKMSLFTVNTQRERERDRKRGREGEVRWCQRWDFADSIFTHQTELFPVSTWPNSRSHHLALSLSVYLCFISSPSLSLPLRSSFWPVPFQTLLSFISCLSFSRHCNPVLVFLPFIFLDPAISSVSPYPHPKGTE